MRASSANIPKSTAPRQGARSLQIRKAVGSAPSESTARLSLGADLPAPCPFMANPPPAISAGGWLPGAIRAKCPSVISVTYGVSYAAHNALKYIRKSVVLVPKGSNFGSERVKLWFRKGQTGFPPNPVPDRSNRRVPERSKFPV
jgi:hypothetical protein